MMTFVRRLTTAFSITIRIVLVFAILVNLLLTGLPISSDQFQSDPSQFENPTATFGEQLSSDDVGDTSREAVPPAITSAHFGLPLAFIPYSGEPHHYQLHHANQIVQFTPSGIAFGGVSLEFVDGNPRTILHPQAPLSGTFNFFFGDQPDGWRTGLPGFGQLYYQDLWSGIDLLLYPKPEGIEQEFIVHPGADPTQIKLNYNGAPTLEVAEDGSLVIQAGSLRFREKAPTIVQEIAGQRQEIMGGFKLTGPSSYAFELESYQADAPLVIDPTLSFSTYLGGDNSDFSFDVKTDPDGNIYLSGVTNSSDFPATPEAYDSTRNDSSWSDAFVAKFSPAGDLIFATYLGGDGRDEIYGMEVDNQGDVYLTGATFSGNFPTTEGVFQPTIGGGQGWDSFISKLASDGQSLIFSSFLGGTNDESGHDIAFDPIGDIYVTGATRSTDFPTTEGAFQTTYGGSDDNFVTKISADASAMLYSTYLGGSAGEGIFTSAVSIAVDTEGHAYLTGSTWSADFPTTPGVFQSLHADAGNGTDAFVTKLNSTGTALIYSSFLGGVGGLNGIERGNDIAVDSEGNAYIVGATESTFPATAGTYFPACKSGDAFLTKVNQDGTALVFSTCINGFFNLSIGYQVALDACNRPAIVGSTSAPDFPLVNPIQSELAGGGETFIAQFDAEAKNLLFSSYLGGSSNEEGFSITVDPQGNRIVAGITFSPDFPTTPGSFQPTWTGTDDTYLAKISADPFILQPQSGGDSGNVTLTIHGCGFQPGANLQLLKTGEGPIIGSLVTVSSNGDRITATFDLTGQTHGLWDVLVQNPDGSSINLPASFTIETYRGPELWVEFVGSSGYRPGRDQIYTVLFGNRGNSNAGGTILWISGIPSHATWELVGGVAPPPIMPGQPTLDMNQVPIEITEGDEVTIPLFIPVLPPDSSRAVSIRINIPDLNSYTLRAWMSKPMCNSPLSEEWKECLVEVLSQLIPIPGVVDCALAAWDTYIAWLQTIDGSDTDIYSYKKVLLQGAYTCLQEFADEFSEIVQLLNNLLKKLLWILQTYQTISKCFDAVQGTLEAFLSITGIFSLDPNEKVGPSGIGPPRYIRAENLIPYTIFFENVITATVPAQDVVITDTLDLEDLDVSTITLGAITFGDRVIFPSATSTLLPGSAEWNSYVDLRPETDLLVRITTHLDETRGLLTWHFISIDPLTGQPTTDPYAGFLPPNVDPPEGEGSVMFRIQPRSALGTGTEITNRAEIVFDANPPIQTDVWINTVDETLPASQVSALPAQQDSSNFMVSWSGEDLDSGIESYSIYVSQDNGSYMPWLVDFPLTYSTFTGAPGHDYAFYSLARDWVGNYELPPQEPDTATRIPFLIYLPLVNR